MRTIKTKLIFIGILAGVVSLILAGVNMYSATQGTKALATVYENQVEPVSALNDMDRTIKEIRFRMAGVILDQMPALGSNIHLKEARNSVPKHWAQFKEKTKDNTFSEEARGQIEKIDAKLKLLSEFLDKLEKAYASEDNKIVSSLLEDEWPVVQSGLLKPIDQLVIYQQAAVMETYEASQARGKKTIALGLGVLLASLLVMAVSIYMIAENINRGIKALKDTLAKVAQGDLTATVPFKRDDEIGDMGRSLDDTTSHLKSIIGKVKGAAESAAQSSSNLSSQLDQMVGRSGARNERVMHVAAAMEEISVANSEVAHSASDAGEAARRNEEFAGEGDSNMGKNQAAMNKVVATAHNSASTVSNLNGSIQKIGQITTVIKEIAEQTNLLALNAAIEAARAGEQGRGFAVVADEVRKLAERTSSSTQEISGVVESIRKETEAAVSAMSEVEHEIMESSRFNNQTGEALKQIVTAANQVNTLVGHIIENTKEQASATEAVARNMEEISALTEENSASIQRVGKEALDVSSVASELQHLVSKFRV